MNLAKNYTMPQYIDGQFEVYDKVNVGDGDFKELKIRKRDMNPVWYRELAVYDRTQLEFYQAHKQVTIKLAIPQWDGISSDCVIMIDGRQHEVFNCAQVISKQGYRETEITCISPEADYEVTE